MISRKNNNRKKLASIVFVSVSNVYFTFFQAYNEKSHKADDYIRMIEARLDQAVSQCISAAGALFQPTHQKQLMRAAKFGNSFLQVKR